MQTIACAVKVTDQLHWRRAVQGEQYWGMAQRCLEILGSGLGINDVARRDLMHLRAVLIEQGRKDTTVDLYMRTFLRAMRVAKEYGYAKQLSDKDMRLPRLPEQERRVITPHEERTLYDTMETMTWPKPHQVPKALLPFKFPRWVRFMLLTGLRLEECLPPSLKKGHPRVLTWDRLERVTATSGREVRVIRVDGKGKGRAKRRRVPLAPEAEEILREVQAWNRANLRDRDPKGLVFSGISQPMARRHLKRIQRRAMIPMPWITPHTLRRTFATRHSQTGKYKQLQRLMGHASIHTTLGYVTVDDRMLADSMEEFGEHPAMQLPASSIPR